MRVAPPPSLVDIVGTIDAERLSRIVFRGREVDGRGEYLHWDKLRRLEPPGDLSHEEWWAVLKVARNPFLRQLPLRDSDGLPFEYCVPDEAFRLLHFVDQRCSGEIAMAEVVTADEQAGRRYLVNSLMEEAIRSSQLEGATTSRVVAKELLRSGREPKDRSERMIVHNYLALQFMRDQMGERLTPGAVLELHRILTDGTLDNPDAAGRLQRPDEERVAVFDRITDKRVHTPPPADELPARLQALCDFANEPDDADHFIHPVLRAILLHLWLAYDHPFEDGNGRTARALFYWFMRNRGYWLVEYLSISQILRQAPAQYQKSFLLTETDERDATYFLLHHLRVIERAIEELYRYLARKTAEVQTVERLIHSAPNFNHRQLALLGDAVRDGTHVITMRSHATSHKVTEETARTDLLDLVDRGLLEKRRSGRRHTFTPAPDLTDLLQALK